jgi:hypothetical protein
MFDVVQARGSLTADQCLDLLERSQEEWEKHRALWKVAIAFGRKGD